MDSGMEGEGLISQSKTNDEAVSVVVENQMAKYGKCDSRPSQIPNMSYWMTSKDRPDICPLTI